MITEWLVKPNQGKHYICHLPCDRAVFNYTDGMKCCSCGKLAPKAILDAGALAGNCVPPVIFNSYEVYGAR